LYYDIPVARYGGKWKMTELITKNCWWPKVIKDVGKYIDIYNLYQRIKNRIEVLVGKLKLSKVPEKL